MTKTKAILKVQFKTRLSEERLAVLSSEEMPVLAEVPGLISKLYHVNPESGYVGAVYHFENEISADAYLQSPVIKNLESRYSTVQSSLQVEKVKVIFDLPGKNTSDNEEKIVSGKWKAITNEKTFEETLEASKQKVVLIFKNSNRCPISRSILRKLDGLLKQSDPGNTGYYLLDILSHRELSDKVAATFAVKHASPQVLLIKNQSCIAHFSKMEIDCGQLIEKISALSQSSQDEPLKVIDDKSLITNEHLL